MATKGGRGGGKGKKPASKKAAGRSGKSSSSSKKTSSGRWTQRNPKTGRFTSRSQGKRTESSGGESGNSGPRKR